MLAPTLFHVGFLQKICYILETPVHILRHYDENYRVSKPLPFCSRFFRYNIEHLHKKRPLYRIDSSTIDLPLRILFFSPTPAHCRTASRQSG